MDTDHNHQAHQGLAIGLILVGVVARLVPHAPNVTPLTAMALFGATYLSRRWGILLPLATVILSDLILGLHETILFTWGGFALTGLVGWWLRRQPSAGRIVASAVAGSFIFFLVSNFGVWLLGDGGTMYPKTAEGLWSCFVAALPFYRNTLVGDLVYTAGFFGLYAWVNQRVLVSTAARVR